MTTLQQMREQSRQYKEKYPNVVILMRGVDYYWCMSDGKDVAKVCDLPVYAGDGFYFTRFKTNTLDWNLPKIIRAGFRVAIGDMCGHPFCAGDEQRAIEEGKRCVTFTTDFYRHLYAEIERHFSDVDYDADRGGLLDEFSADGYDVEMTVYYDYEWKDDSFDHAFGTWNDPDAHYEAVGVQAVQGVRVWVSETNEEVAGFDYDDFRSAVK